jgi:hypothetical protein
VLAPLGAPFVLLGAGAGEAEDGPLGRGGALAGLPELVLFIPGVIIGGLGTEGPLGRLGPPVKNGRMTAGADFSEPLNFGGCWDALRCVPS